MAFDLSMDDQAITLFLAEAGELCQQFEEGLLLLSHDPSAVNFKKIARIAQAIEQGAGQMGFVDLQLLALGLRTLLARYGEDTVQASAFDLLHQVCDSLQCSLIVHRATPNSAEDTPQLTFVLHALIPKALDILTLSLAQTLEADPQQKFPQKQFLQQQFLEQQVQWIQWWSNELDLAEFKMIAEATSRAIATFSNTVNTDGYGAIFTVAIAGFQVAHRATLQQLESPEPDRTPEPDFTEPQRLNSLDSLAQTLEAKPLTTLDLSQHLAGLARHVIFCVATQSIEEIVLPQPNQRLHKNGQAYLDWNGALLTLHRFVDLWPSPEAIAPSKAQAPPDELILVLKDEPQPLALALEVDRLIVDPELTLEQPDHIITTPHPYRWGWTRVDEGIWVEVVDVNALIQGRSHPEDFTINLGSGVSTLPTHKSRATFSAGSTALPLSPPSKNILIVDDSKMVREILSLTLQDAGYEVMQARDGQEAIAHLQQQTQIHLTICDLEMSNLNGFEFLRHRLQDERWVKIPVLILSSHTSDEYRQLAQKLGAADYLTIPYEPLMLLKTIQTLLRH
jgi:CheY-like chemotaxis protein/chemotaxis protein histidine kinase CheA